MQVVLLDFRDLDPWQAVERICGGSFLAGGDGPGVITLGKQRTGTAHGVLFHLFTTIKDRLGELLREEWQQDGDKNDANHSSTKKGQQNAAEDLLAFHPLSLGTQCWHLFLRIAQFLELLNLFFDRLDFLALFRVSRPDPRRKPREYQQYQPFHHSRRWIRTHRG